MGQRPLFSIIIPTYGRPRFLEEAVQSVLAQSITDFECIVVDDASPERVQVVGDPRLRLIRRRENGGPAAARNTGLEMARGQYVAFLDDDDLYLPNRLELALAGLQRAAVALCWATHIGAKPDGRVLEGVVPGLLLAGTTPALGATALPRSITEPFDDAYLGAEDVEWWLRTASRHAVATTPEVGCLIRRHSGARLLHGTRARIEGSVRLLREHDEFFSVHRAAASFRWFRVGLMSLQAGDKPAARAAFTRSLRITPSLRSVRALAKTFLPTAAGQ